MSQLFLPPPGLLFVSLLYNKDLMAQADVLELWKSKWGEGVCFKPTFNPMKDYYSSEMGESSKLERIILLGEDLYERETLIEAKLWAVEIENLNSITGRSVNIDPGLMTLENIILATGKIYGHRPYLGKGVYADLNLIYTSGSYSPLEWTYPDYKSREVINFFNEHRDRLHNKLKSEKLDVYNTRRNS